MHRIVIHTNDNDIHFNLSFFNSNSRRCLSFIFVFDWKLTIVDVKYNLSLRLFDDIAFESIGLLLTLNSDIYEF